jgi:hypothetical protein
MNQVLEQYLRCYINYEENDWVEKLPDAQLAYSTAYNESTRLTSIRELRIHAQRFPSTTRPENNQPSRHTQERRFEEPTRRNENRTRICQKQNEQLLQSKTVEGTNLFGGRHGLPSHQKRQHRPTKQKARLQIHRTLQSHTENLRKQLRTELTIDSQVPSNLSRFITRISSRHDTPQTGNESREITGPEVYEAEAIREMRKQNGKTENLIKWKNYPESESTKEMSRARITTIVDNFTVAMNSKSQAASYCLDDRQTEHEYKRPTLVAPLNRKSSAHLILAVHLCMR